MGIRWDQFVNQFDASRYVTGGDARDHRHIQFVREFDSVVSILQDKTNNVIDLYKDITRAIEELATCPYTSEAFTDLLGKIQAAVGLLSLQEFITSTHILYLIDRSPELGGLC